MTRNVELHVLPHEPDGTWMVGMDSSSRALSSHETADQAQLAASRLAEAQGADRLYMHDRYARVRMVMLNSIRH